jgi:hypothetical protein
MRASDPASANNFAMSLIEVVSVSFSDCAIGSSLRTSMYSSAIG